MVMLSDLDIGRANNLNLIRMVAASAVLVSHAYPIALGAGAVEPLEDLLGLSLGSMAVDVFFSISGYLITASFLRSSSHTGFLAARFLRLFPGLFANLVFVAFLLAPIVTTLDPVEYLTSAAPYEFVINNLSLYFMQYTLPGVFTDLPTQAIVGSIWTLFYEVACYGGVFVLGLLGLLRDRRAACLALGLYFVVWFVIAFWDPELPHRAARFHRLSPPFVLGMAFFIWRDRLPVSLWGGALTTGLAWLLRDTPLSRGALELAVCYGTFWLAFVPGGWVRRYNQIGDYSYGIYVYAFPLQGMAVWLFGTQSPLENMLYSFLPTLLLSVLSWHVIEKPALRTKGAVVRRLRRQT